LYLGTYNGRNKSPRVATKEQTNGRTGDAGAPFQAACFSGFLVLSTAVCTGKGEEEVEVFGEK
jgi:hypothetical protein